MKFKKYFVKEKVTADQLRKNMPGYIGTDIAKKGTDEDLLAIASLKDKLAQIKNNQIKPLRDQINNIRKKYKLKPDKYV